MGVYLHFANVLNMDGIKPKTKYRENRDIFSGIVMCKQKFAPSINDSHQTMFTLARDDTEC